SLYARFLLTPRPLISTLFPYTTLFRSSTRICRSARARGALVPQTKMPSRPPSLRGSSARVRRVPGRIRTASYRRRGRDAHRWSRSEEHTSELQSLRHLVCRLLLEKKNS